MSASKKKKKEKEKELAPDSEEQLRISRLKCWKRWMVHADPGCFNGWFVADGSSSVAAGW